MFQSLHWFELGDRRLKIIAGAIALLVLCLAFVDAITTDNLQLTIKLLALVALPGFIILALRRPLIFPYSLYVIMTPFDNLLLIQGAGTITKMLGLASTFFIFIDIVRRRRIARPSIALYCFLAYLAYNALSLAWTPDLSGALGIIQTLTSLIAMYAVLSLAPIDQRDLRIVCSCIVLGGVAASLYGTYLLHNSPQLAGDYGRLMIDVGDRTVDPNHFANSLLAPLALALVTLVHARRPLHILIALGAVVIICTGIEISLSREALLATFAMTVVLAWFSRKRLISFAILVPTLLVLPILVPSISLRMLDAFSTGGGGRLSIWQVGWRAFSQHPFFGWGLNSAFIAYDRNFLAIHSFYSGGWSRPPHNTPLRFLVELGVVGLLLVALMYAATFRQLDSVPRSDSIYDLRAGLTASLVGVLIVSVFIDLATYKYLWLVLTTSAQFSVVASSRRPLPAASDRLDVRLSNRRYFKSLGVLVASTLLVLMSVGALLFQWSTHREDASAFEARVATVPSKDARIAPIAFLQVDDVSASAREHFTYLGRWQHLSNAHDGRSRGTSSRTFHAGAAATLRFTGSKLRIYGVLGPNGGNAQIRIDGADYGILNFYAANKRSGVKIFETSHLTSRMHTVAIILMPPLEARFKRRFMNLDGAAFAP